jgi:hypothetical protein
LSANQVTEYLWEFNVKGESKNIYKQKLTSEQFSCSCIDQKMKKGFCKHLLFLISRVANQNEIASIVCEEKTRWNKELFEICTQKWIQRLIHLKKLMEKSTDNTNPPKDYNINKDAIGNDCPICFEDMTKDDSLKQCVLTCKNFFHTDCINMWINTGHDTCPLCRGSLDEDTANDSDPELEDGISTSIKVNIGNVDTNLVSVENTTSNLLCYDIVFLLETSPCIYPCILMIQKNVESIINEYFDTFDNLRIGIITCKQNLDLTSDKKGIINFINDIDSSFINTETGCRYYTKMSSDINKMQWKITGNIHKHVIILGDSIRHHIGYTADEVSNKLKHRNIKTHTIQGLYHGSHFSYQYYNKFHETGGYHLYLDQLVMICDMLLAICWRLKNLSVDDPIRTQKIQDMKKNMLNKYGSQNISVILFFDILTNNISEDECYRKRSPWCFANKYKFTQYLELCDTKNYNFKTPHSKKDNDGYICYSYELEYNRKKDKIKKQCTLMKYQIVEVPEDCTGKTMYELCNTKYRSGGVFYELTKRELINNDNDIVLANRETGQLYDAEDAKELLSLSVDENNCYLIDPSATNLASYRIFVEYNGRRKLQKGTGFMYRTFPLNCKYVHED